MALFNNYFSIPPDFDIKILANMMECLLVKGFGEMYLLRTVLIFDSKLRKVATGKALEV